MILRGIIRFCTVAVLAAALLACGKEPQPAGGGSGSQEPPVVTVLYDVQALGDCSYNDLIYAGVERAALKHGFRTVHHAPLSASDGQRFLQETITAMSGATDGVKRLLIVTSEAYDALLRQNNKKLESNPDADLLYLETDKPFDGKGSTLILPYYGAMYEAGALLPAFSIQARVVGANPQNVSVAAAIDGFRDGFATSHVVSSKILLQGEKTLTVEYLSQTVSGGYSISDADALKFLYPGGEQFWQTTTLVPVCGGAGVTFARLIDIFQNYMYLGIDVAVPSPYSHVAAVKHIDEAVGLCIGQWLKGEMPAHQSLGLESGYTGVVLNPIDKTAKEAVELDLPASLRETIHREAIAKEAAYGK